MKKLIYLLPILGLFLLVSCESKTVVTDSTGSTNQEISSNNKANRAKNTILY